MSELASLYQEVILDHYKRPRNFGALAAADRRIEGNNPLCGDRITLYLKLEGDQVSEVAFEGSGCAISTASASLLTEACRGRSTGEARRLSAEFRQLLTAAGDGPVEVPEHLGKLVALTGVREYPMRVKCATLAWHALEAALAGAREPVTTE